MSDAVSAPPPPPTSWEELNDTQRASFTQFKEKLTQEKRYKPATGESEASHDDATLLRFLRARSYDPEGAYKQFAAAEDWRSKHDVWNVYVNIDPADLEDARRFYPRWTGRRDKHGLPLYVYRLASVKAVQKELDALTSQQRFQRIIALYEAMTHFAFPLCSYIQHPRSPAPVADSTTIIDLKDTSLTSMWNLRNHLQEASKLATANYPETLHIICVVNSPSFFPTVWNWIKGWFDEGTRRKIFVLGSDPGPTLRELVDPSNLPKEYGGELQWTYTDEPSLEEAIAKVIDTMPVGPVVFSDGKVSRPVAQNPDGE